MLILGFDSLSRTFVMKIRRRGGEEQKVELQMTPMIDIVFQLLVFFIMTFKIVAQEGDFNIKMPLAAPNESTPDDSLDVPVRLEILADANGNLAEQGIRLNNNLVFSDFNSLHAHIRGMMGDDAGPGSTGDVSVEMDFDYQLRYKYAIDAVTAVSGYLDANGNVVKLIDSIKFAPPQRPVAE